jgi:hypothetical protein
VRDKSSLKNGELGSHELYDITQDCLDELIINQADLSYRFDDFWPDFKAENQKAILSKLSTLVDDDEFNSKIKSGDILFHRCHKLYEWLNSIEGDFSQEAKQIASRLLIKLKQSTTLETAGYLSEQTANQILDDEFFYESLDQVGKGLGDLWRLLWNINKATSFQCSIAFSGRILVAFARESFENRLATLESFHGGEKRYTGEGKKYPGIDLAALFQQLNLDWHKALCGGENENFKSYKGYIRFLENKSLPQKFKPKNSSQMLAELYSSFIEFVFTNSTDETLNNQLALMEILPKSHKDYEALAEKTYKVCIRRKDSYGLVTLFNSCRKSTRQRLLRVLVDDFDRAPTKYEWLDSQALLEEWDGAILAKYPLVMTRVFLGNLSEHHL